MVIKDNDNRTEKKIVVQWIFAQSAALVIALLALGLQMYDNFKLNARIDKLEQRQEIRETYIITVLKETVDKNTESLKEFNSFKKGQNSR